MQCSCVILSSVACCGLRYFFLRYLLNDTNLEKALMITKCAFGVSEQCLSEVLLILRKFERDVIMVIVV
jgi:hypothetical protein